MKRIKSNHLWRRGATLLLAMLMLFTCVGSALPAFAEEAAGNTATVDSGDPVLADSSASGDSTGDTGTDLPDDPQRPTLPSGEDISEEAPPADESDGETVPPADSDSSEDPAAPDSGDSIPDESESEPAEQPGEGDADLPEDEQPSGEEPDPDEDEEIPENEPEDEPFEALVILDPENGAAVQAGVGEEVTFKAPVSREDVAVAYQWQRFQKPAAGSVQTEALYDYAEGETTEYWYALDDMREAEALAMNPDMLWPGIEMYYATVAALDEIGADSSDVSIAWKTPNFALEGYTISAAETESGIEVYADKDDERHVAHLNENSEWEFGEAEEKPETTGAWLNIEGANGPEYAFTVEERDYDASFRCEVTVLDEVYLEQCLSILEEQGIELTEEQRAAEQKLYSVVMSVENGKEEALPEDEPMTFSMARSMLRAAASGKPQLSADAQWIEGLDGNYQYITITAEWQYSTDAFDPYNGGAYLEWHDVKGSTEWGGLEVITVNAPQQEYKAGIVSALSEVNPSANTDVFHKNAKFHGIQTFLTVDKVDIAQHGTHFRVKYTAISSHGTKMEWYSNIADEKSGAWTTDTGMFGGDVSQSIKNNSNILNVKRPELEIITTPSALCGGAPYIDTMTPDEYGQMLLLSNAAATMANGTATYEAILYYKPGDLVPTPTWQYMTYTDHAPKFWADSTGNKWTGSKAQQLGVNVTVTNTDLGDALYQGQPGYKAIKSVMTISNVPASMYNPETLTKYYFRCIGVTTYTTVKDTYSMARVDKWGGLVIDYAIDLHHNGVVNYGNTNIINGATVTDAAGIVQATTGRQSSVWTYPKLSIHVPAGHHINTAIVYFDSKVAHNSNDYISYNTSALTSLGITVQEADANNEIKRGEIYYITFAPVVGSEQHGGRPGIVVSNNMNNAHSNTIEVVYLTTQPKKMLPTHTTITATGRDSVALCEQINTVDKSRVGLYIGELSAREMAAVEEAITASLALRIENARPKIPYACMACKNMGDIEETINRASVSAQRDAYKAICETLIETINNKN